MEAFVNNSDKRNCSSGDTTTCSTSLDFKDYLIKEAPKCIYYIPNFISEVEERDVLKNIYSAPKPKWVQLSNRRLQNWGGLPHQKGMVAEHIPWWLENQMKKVDELHPFDEKNSNHVLVNEYLPGQGIMPHVDGPLFYPTITTINLGSHTLLDFYEYTENKSDSGAAKMSSSSNPDSSAELSLDKKGSLLLEPRSLLIIQKDAYVKLLHGIDMNHNDTLDDSVFNLNQTNYSAGDNLTRETRISLTIRYFPKVLKTTIFGGRRR